MKSAVILAPLAIACIALPGSSHAAPTQPEAAAIIQDVLYGQVDLLLARADTTERSPRPSDAVEIVRDDLELSSTRAATAESEEDELDALSPEERLRRMIRVLRSLPFKTRQEQINDLLATVHTLSV